jgi:hypothetical protein
MMAKIWNRRAAPAAPDDMAYLVSYLRAMIDDESERTRRGEGETLELNAAADMLESLSTRCTALEADIAQLRFNHPAEGTVRCTCNSYPHTPNCGLDERLVVLRGVIAEHNKRCEREWRRDGLVTNPLEYMIEAAK